MVWRKSPGFGTSVPHVKNLAEIYRYSIRKRRMVPLMEEISHIRNYFSIHKLRNAPNFDYFIHTDPGVRHCPVPRLLLQPLIENAFIHGIDDLEEGGGYIAVIASIEEDLLLIKIIDNGLGMSEEQARELNAQLQKEKDGLRMENQADGVGILNVNARIRIQFGDDYGLSFRSDRRNGTTAFLRLPLLSPEEQEG